jgi:hypothetical protein
VYAETSFVLLLLEKWTVIIFAYAFELLIISQSGVVCDCGNHVRKVYPFEVSVDSAACHEYVVGCLDLQTVKQPDQPTCRSVLTLSLCIAVVDAPSVVKLNLASWK